MEKESEDKCAKCVKVENKYNIGDIIYRIDTYDAVLYKDTIGFMKQTAEGFEYSEQGSDNSSQNIREEDIITDLEVAQKAQVEALEVWKQKELDLMVKRIQSANERSAKYAHSIWSKGRKPQIFKPKFSVGQKVYTFSEYEETINEGRYNESKINKMSAESFTIATIQMNDTQSIHYAPDKGYACYEKYVYATQEEVDNLIAAFVKRNADEKYGIVDLDKEK